MARYAEEINTLEDAKSFLTYLDTNLNPTILLPIQEEQLTAKQKGLWDDINRKLNALRANTTAPGAPCNLEMYAIELILQSVT